MQTAIYIFWVLIPAIYCLFALYSWLEAIGKKRGSRKEEADNLVRQAAFLSISSAICFALDIFLIVPNEDAIMDMMPLTSDLYWVAKILLYPIFMYVTGLMIGESERPEIERKNPSALKKKSSQKRRRRR